MLTLNLTALSGEPIVSIFVDKTHTIRDIKRFLIDHGIIDDSKLFVNISLIYKDSFLEFDKTIEEYGIDNNDNITIIDNHYEESDLTLIAVMMFFNTPKHSNMGVLYISSNFTIKELKSYIKEVYHYNINKFKRTPNEIDGCLQEITDENITVKEAKDKYWVEMVIILEIEKNEKIKDNKIKIMYNKI